MQYPRCILVVLIRHRIERNAVHGNAKRRQRFEWYEFILRCQVPRESRKYEDVFLLGQRIRIVVIRELARIVIRDSVGRNHTPVTADGFAHPGLWQC